MQPSDDDLLLKLERRADEVRRLKPVPLWLCGLVMILAVAAIASAITAAALWVR